MKKIIGTFFCLISGFLAGYLGIWVCFIGGIVDIINAVKIDPTPGLLVLMGVAKVFFTSFVIWFFLTIGAIIAAYCRV